MFFKKYLKYSLTLLLILVIFLTSFITPTTINANYNNFTVSVDKSANASNNKNTPSQLYARYAALIDADSKRLLYGKDSDVIAPNASTTKIMTLITALEICPKDYVVTTSAYAASMPDVQLNATTGEQFVIDDLYYSLMLKSHNDTAAIIAENAAYYYLCTLNEQQRNEISQDLSFINDFSMDSTFIKNLSKEQSRLLIHIFVSLMNKKAFEEGCTNTHFVTPNGLDATDEEGKHSTTAYELAVMMSYCIQNQDFLKITQTPSHSFNNMSGKNYSVSNSNAFLSMYKGVISGKTGFTNDAGYCYVCAYKDNDRTFIVTLLACGWPNNKTYKWSDTRKLLDYAKENYSPATLLDNKKTFNIAINKGSKNCINIPFEEHFTTCISSFDEVNVNYNIPSAINAPIKEGDIIGNLTITINDNVIKQYNIYCPENINKRSTTQLILHKIKTFFAFFVYFNNKIMT